MADNLIFPIGFDLEKGVIEAGKDADKYLRQLENTLRQKPIRLDVAIDGAAPGSIDAISKRMAALSNEFNKLTEAQRVYNRTSGEFTPEAQKIINEYAELTAATQTYAQSLSQITAAAKRQTQEQMKAQEQEIKRYEEYWKRKEAENAKQAQQEVANGERVRKIQQQRISQEQAADAKRYQEWLRQKNQEAVETERVERQKQQSRERTIAQQNREFAAQLKEEEQLARLYEAQTKQNVQNIVAREQALAELKQKKREQEAASRRELQMLNQQYAAEEQRSQKQRQEAISASLRAEYQRIEAKKQAEAASRRELQLLNQQYAAEERRQRLAASQASIAKRQQVIKTLRAEENTIVNITAKLQHWQQVMNSSAMDGRQFRRAAEEVQRLSQKLSEAQARISQLTATTSNASTRQSAAVRQVSQEFKKQDGYVSRLLKRMAVYASFSYAGNFLTSVREVTAQFELQRVSLGAIIQDQQRANALFSEIKSFALKSPVSIIDLTKYTKQLAAYKIGIDELFETTKKLTDVSVGLGVSMDRVVLAYGQVRATGYLRASEIRQFTEMGVPIVEELAAKLSNMNDELVTAAQVMDMVSKRGISFELVKEVFDDMTSAGGIFYNMQEKQGNTLFGLWAKLGDAASMMYDQIGNTESLNNGMKAAIGLLTEFMRNWKAVGATLSIDAVGAGIYLLAKKSIQKGASIEAEKVAAATRNRAKAQAELNVQLKQGTRADIAAARAALQKAQADENAAISASKNVTVAGKLKTGLLSIGKSFLTGLGWGAVIALVSTLVFKLADAVVNANRLKKELDGIASETGTEISRLVTNFESLAKKAVEAADGSREQKDALSELQRTYRSIIPEQNLTIDKLREMKGEYTNLTIAIREYIREQQLQKGLSAISEKYVKQIIDAEGELKKNLKDARFGAKGGAVFAINEKQIDRIVGLFKKLVQEGKSAQEALQTAFQYEGIDHLVESYDKLANDLGLIKKYQASTLRSKDTPGFKVETFWVDEGVRGLTKAIQDEEKAIAEWKKQMDGTVSTLGKLSIYIDAAKKKISEHEFISKEQTFAYDQETARVQINSYIEALEEAIKNTNVSIDLSKFITIDPNGIKRLDFEGLKDALAGLDSQWKVPLQDFAKEVQNVYDGFIPNDRTTASLRNQLEQITAQTGASMDKMRNFLMKNGDNWKDYSKKIEDSIKDYKDAIEEMNKSNAAVTSGENSVLKMYSTEEIETANKEMQTLILLLEYLKKSSSFGRTSQSDPRLGILQEMASTLKQVNKEYDELAKKEGATKALVDTQDKYANTFKYLQSLVTEYNFELPDFGVPTDAASLTKYLDVIKEVIKKLPKSAKPVLSQETDIADINMADVQKKIEKQLKQLSDRISRTKTAKEFYEKILKSTGDASLALNMTTSIYGEDGQDLKEQVINQIKTALSETKVELPAGIIDSDNNIDYKALREFAEKAKETRAIGEGAADKLIEIAENGEKELSRVAQEGAKLLLKYDEIAQKRVNIEQEASDKIRQLREAEAVFIASQATKEQKEAYSKRTNKAVAGVEAKRNLDLLKLQDEYLRFFSAIHSLTNKEAEELRTKVRDALFKAFQDGAISADELKRELKAVDEQFQKLIEDSGMAMDYLQGGFDGLKKRLRETADEVQSVAIEISNMESPDDISEGQKSFIDKILRMFGDETTGRSFEGLFSKTNGDLKQMGGLLGKVSDKIGGIVAGFSSASAIADMIVQAVNSDIKGIAQIRDQLNAMRSENNQLDGGFWKGFEYLENFNKYAYSGWEKLKSGDAIGSVFDVISSIISIFGTAQAQKIRKINKEIENQEKLLERLEYSYSRLEKQAEKAFGADYLQLLNAQMENLEAQAEAARKKAEAERSKGKKADEEKVKQYLDEEQKILDELHDMQYKFAEEMLGTDLTSAAKDFARAWLDAYISFGNTTDAMKGKFKDLIKNMIVNSVLGEVMEQALLPIFDMIKGMKEDDFSSPDFWNALRNKMYESIEYAEGGAENVAKLFEAIGFDLRELGEGKGFTGIAKNIAGATSEEINNVAAIGNTLMYYVSPIPRIDENLARVVAIMEGRGASAIPQTASAGWTDWQQQAMDNYIAIQRNTADTVVECRRAADACEKMTRLIKVKGATQGLNVFVN